MENIEVVEFLKNKKVLVVEDELDIQEIFKNFMHKVGIECHFALNGREGLQMVENQSAPYDVIITDINMPIMNGFSMIEHMRNANVESKIVILSAYHTEEHKNKARLLEVDCFIHKPLDFKVMLACLKDLYL